MQDPRIRQLLQQEVNKIKNKIVEEAKKEAEEEFKHILRHAEEKAEQIIEAARKEAGQLLRVQQEQTVLLKEKEKKDKKEYYPFEGKETDTLVIHCSDHRFRKAFEIFLKEELGVENYDSLVIPGASQLLSFMNFLPKFSGIFDRLTKFLVEKHGIKKIIVIMHENCGWDRHFVPKYFLNKGTEKEQQIRDMLLMKKWVRENFPGLTVEMFYASLVQNKGVQFSRIEETAK